MIVAQRQIPSHVLLILVSAALLFPFYFTCWSAPAAGLSYDDGIYIASAKSLAEGRGYTLPSLPYENTQTKYPIMFSFLLSLVWRAAPHFPENAQLLKLVPLAGTILWLCTVYLLAAQLRFTKLRAAAITVIAAASPAILTFSGTLMPESIFAFFATASILFLVRAERSGSLRETLSAAILAGCAYHTRTAAVAIFAGGFIGLMWARKLKLAVIFGTACVLLSVPWIVWQMGQVSVPPVEAYYTSLSYRDWNIIANFDWSQKVTILLKNLRLLFVEPSYMIGVPGIYVLYVAVSALFWILFCIGVKRIGSRMFACVLSISVLMPILWAWEPFRFLIPSIPLLLLSASCAIDRTSLSFAASAVVFPCLLVSLFVARSTTLETGLPKISYEKPEATWSQAMAAEKWISAHCLSGDVVISSTDAMLYLYGGVREIRGMYVDPLPLFYGLPPNVDNGKELPRVLKRYKPKYFIRVRPGFHEDPHLDAITDRMIASGAINEEYSVGRVHIFRVTEFSPSSHDGDFSEEVHGQASVRSAGRVEPNPK